MKTERKVRPFAFDFDGVIAEYNGFVSKEHTGGPIPEVVKATRKLKENGHTIILHSTRDDELLRKYCVDNDIPFDYINENPKFNDGKVAKPVAFAYVDDRAVRYKGQSADELVEELENFKAYWEK